MVVEVGNGGTGLASCISRAVEQSRNFGERHIEGNYDQFHMLLGKAERFLERGALDTAGVYASIAAFHASARHCGLWASPELERVLHAIGERLPVPARRCGRSLVRPEKICHVATTVGPVGGLTRMLSRWIREDRLCQHSLVLTRQSTEEVPRFLREPISNTGGHVSFVDAAVGGLTARAAMLRRIAAAADLIVLHIHPSDAVPIIALATSNLPPVVLLDHADHSFWLGTRVSDVILSMRDSGRRLSVERRGIDPARIALLPTILEPTQRQMAREEAKRSLGLPDDCVLLVSVARARKYRPLADVTYADLHIQTLINHPNCVLMVVGPGEQEDWYNAKQRTNGRIVALPEHEDPAIFLQAADIYVDSFPFVSITSVLEAGLYGTPAITLFPYSNACGILGCDMPGLNAHLLKCHTLNEYWAVLSRLILDPDWRIRVGEALANDIAEHHTNGKWLRLLTAAYEQALSVNAVHRMHSEHEYFKIHDLDLHIQAIHGGSSDGEWDAERLLMYELGLLPLKTRIKEWWRLRRAGILYNTSRYGPAIYLVPDWARCRAGRFRRRLPTLLGRMLRLH